MGNFLEQASVQNQNRFKSSWFIIPLAIILIGSIIFVFQNFVKNNGQVQGEKVANVAPQVKTMVLGGDGNGQANIATVGTVKADSKVEVVAMVNGTARGVYFKTGDTVTAKQVLISLYDSTLLANLNNAQTNAGNMQLSYDSNQRTLDENIRQAELGIRRAQESVGSVAIGLQTAEDNLANARNLQEKNKEDIKNNAVISYHNYLNAVSSGLDQVNYLLGEDKDSGQLPGISSTLGVTNLQTVTDAKNKYTLTRAVYFAQDKAGVNTDDVLAGVKAVAQLLSQTKDLIDSTIAVLNHTIANSNFPDSALMAQRSLFSNLRSTVINAQVAAQATLNSLQNVDLVNKQQLDALQNAVNIARSQLTLAQTGYDTAVAALASARKGKEQALIGAKAALDNARGQLNIIQTQAADLSVEAPIAGVVTQKSVELGGEVRAGQKLAEISQNDAVKIIVGISSEDVYKIKLGQPAAINDNLAGAVTRIDPAADAMTKKVTVEITYDNKDKKLIAETFVDVKMPVQSQSAGPLAGSFFVPLQAVSITPNETFVFIVKDGKAAKIPVELGITEGEKIEVTSGLRNGDEVITEGNKELEEGQNVQTQN